MKIPQTEGASMKGYFANIGLSVGEWTTERPAPKKKEKTWAKEKLVYKYPRTRKFF